MECQFSKLRLKTGHLAPPFVTFNVLFENWLKFVKKDGINDININILARGVNKYSDHRFAVKDILKKFHASCHTQLKLGRPPLRSFFLFDKERHRVKDED